MEELNIISFIHNNGLFFSLYNYFILFLFIITLAILFYLNNYFYKMNRNIEEDMEDNIPFARDLIERYKLLLQRQQDIVDTASFIDNYYLEKRKLLLTIINIIENSDKIFILLGFFGGFIIILNALINFNFELISSFQELYNQFGSILYNLKPALFILLIGIISAIFIKIILKSINLRDRFNTIKKRLENHLENNIKYKYNRELKELELLTELIKTVDNGFIRLEKAISEIAEINAIKMQAYEYARTQDYTQVAVTEEEDS